MKNLKPIVIVIVALTVLCGASAICVNTTLINAPHAIDSAALYQNSIAFQKAFDAVNSSYKTIDNQTSVISQQNFVIGLLALGFLGVGVVALVFSAQISKAFATLGGGIQQRLPSGSGGTALIGHSRPAGDFVVLNQFAFRRYQRALTDVQAEELYYQLEDLQSILAQRLDWDFVNERESAMVVHESTTNAAGLIDWNRR